MNRKQKYRSKNSTIQVTTDQKAELEVAASDYGVTLKVLLQDAKLIQVKQSQP
jgi:hypothetical protein